MISKPPNSDSGPTPHRDPAHGRGARTDPANRFDRREVDPTWFDDEPPADAPPTTYHRDRSQSVLTRNESPDVPFSFGLNPYRGCEHGCAYCYARPTHEYLGHSAGLDFETKIYVKENAPARLREELSRPSWEPQPVVLSGVTDPYQPVERRRQLTRRCLEVFAEFRNPVSLITKSYLVVRDIDHLWALAQHQAAMVTLSVTTLDATLHRRLEPRASTPARRLEAIRRLTEAGIPVTVNVAPVIPGLTDHEIPAILEAAADAGAVAASWILLRLPYAVKELFDDWLERHVPDRRDRVLAAIRDSRGGDSSDGPLNDTRFGSRMRGEGIRSDSIDSLFRTSARRLGLANELPPLSASAFRPPGPVQLDLF